MVELSGILDRISETMSRKSTIEKSEPVVRYSEEALSGILLIELYQFFSFMLMIKKIYSFQCILFEVMCSVFFEGYRGFLEYRLCYFAVFIDNILIFKQLYFLEKN